MELAKEQAKAIKPEKGLAKAASHPHVQAQSNQKRRLQADDKSCKTDTQPVVHGMR